MLNIRTIINSAGSPLKWRFTKYFTGVEKTPEEAKLHIKQEQEDEKECLERPTDMHTILDLCKKWVFDHVGPDFKFREYQLEYIVQVLYNILNDKIKINCIEAPTGSGKSWIAFVVSGVAWEYYRKTSYILVSDLGLMQQYVDDVDNYNFYDIGKLKGLDNYTCLENQMPFPSGECKLKNMPYNVLLNDKAVKNTPFECALDCPCIQDRKKAIVAPITIMTYNLYLCHMNNVLPTFSNDDGLPPFDKRDIIICDECHKMPSIVQSWASPNFNLKEDQEKFIGYIEFLKSENLFENDEEEICDIFNIVKYQHQIIDNIEDKDKVFNSFKNYQFIQEILKSKNDRAKLIIDEYKKLNKDKLSANLRSVLYYIQWIETRFNQFETYKKMIESIGTDYIVVNSTYEAKKKTYNKVQFVLNCVYEEWMVKKYFNDISNYEIMMSATVGDYQLFEREIGVTLIPDELKESSFSFLRIPSTFNFEKSPIYVLPNFKMTYNLKDKNMPIICSLVDKIVASYANQKGIIHTSSYEFACKLTKGINSETKSRVVDYTNSKEKDYSLDKYRFSRNKVLVGPTLIEGINLPDDECRFMIIIKIPYPSLGDQLVKAKKDRIENWYSGETIKSIIQSLGRGIRHKDDYCTTYILDGSFLSVYYATRNGLQPELIQRIKFVSI